MKLSKLSVLTVALLGSSMAMAATTTTQPYQYNANKGVVGNTAGAVTGTAKTLFETATHPGAISAEIGTLGYGANIAWGIDESTELQAGWSGMSADDTIDLDDDDSWIDYKKALGDGYEDFKGELQYDVDFSNPYIGVQMRPLHNWLTVAGGVIVPDNKFDGRLVAINSNGGNSEVSIDGVDFLIKDGTAVAMNIETKNTLAPYGTIGIRPNINSKWGGFLEAGVAYMGNVRSNVNVIGGDGVTVKGRPDIPTTQAVADFEKKAKNELEFDGQLWYPIVKAGLTYRF